MANEGADSGAPDTPGGDDLFSGARGIEGLLGDDLTISGEDIETDESKGGDEPPPDDEDEDFEEETPEGDEPEEPEDLDDGDESDDEEDDEADDEPSDDEPETYTVRVDGEEIEVTLDEALAGYSRTKDYTRKTMALAEERKALQAQAQEVAASRAEYGQRLMVVQKALQGAVGEEPNWEQLKAQDPDRYAKLRAAYTERREQIQAIEGELGRLREEAEKAHEAERQQLLDENRELLFAKVPEWLDPEVRTAEHEQLVTVASDVYGFSPEELADVVDHRAILILRDAARYHDLTRKQQKVKDEIRSKRRKSPTLKPGAPKSKQDKKRRSAGAARKRLAQSGRLDDAAAAISEILDM